MRRIYTFVAFTFFSISLFAQLPVSQEQANKKVVLEEFTGITCVFCPDGHKIANELAEANEGSFIPVNIHTGGFANPQGPGTDFRTADGDLIANQPGMVIEGYPQGAINRRQWGDPGMAHSRGDWATNSAVVLAEPSYVNVAGEATLDIVTREMTINIEAYYTMEGAPETNKYTVMLLQDNISGPQTGAANFYPEQINPDGTYRHMHMLRDVINPTTLGDEISTTTMGTTFAETLTYTIPANYNGVSAELADMHLVVFISESNTEIMTAAEMPITYTGFTTANNAAIDELDDLPSTCKNSLVPVVRLRNQGSETMTSAELSYSMNGETAQTFNWTGSLSPLASELVELDEISYEIAATNSLSVEVVTVNGGTDEDTADNSASLAFEKATEEANSINMFFDITTDRYGSETTWNVYDENGDVVASGGPYENLASNGTELHEEEFTVDGIGCYNVEILDSYGDGMNSGYGVGGAELRDGYNEVFWVTDGVFSSAEAQDFTVTSDMIVGIVELEAEGFSVYPNPATDNLTIEFDAQNGDYTLSLVDITGRTMYVQNLERINGQQVVTIPVNNYNAGVYIVNIEKEGRRFTQRIMVQ